MIIYFSDKILVPQYDAGPSQIHFVEYLNLIKSPNINWVKGNTAT